MENNINYSGNKFLFTHIYEHYGFGSEESRSGPGSTLEETLPIREKLVELIKEKNIKSIAIVTRWPITRNKVFGAQDKED